MSAQEPPVTVAISRKVRSGKEAEYEKWWAGVNEVAETFPGHLGSGHIRPAEPGGEYTSIYRFDTKEHLDAWLDSPERAEWLEASQPLIEGKPHVERATGIEYWFRDDGDLMPPAVWKQALLTWVGLYPTSFLVQWVLLSYIAGWPLALRAMLSTAVTVPLMTWLVMPNITRLFRRWLRPSPNAARSG